MSTFFAQIDSSSFLSSDTLRTIAGAVVVFVVGFLVLRLIVFILRRIFTRRKSPQLSIVIPRVVNYIGLVVIVSIVLVRAGVDLAPVLGAAGIVGIAVGIASQASLSSIISGFLLASEKTFSVGDIVRIGTKTGIVDSIDLLSIKVRTFDNLYLRFPNEQVARAELTNITRYPIRRMDFTVTVPHDTDLSALMELLRGVAAAHRLVLQEPEPLVLPVNFTEIGYSVLLGVWFSKADFLAVKTDLFGSILTAMRENGMEFAVPPRRLVSTPESRTVQVRDDSGTAEAPPESSP